MISSNSVDESWNEGCKYDINCDKAATHYCQGCGEIYCISHYWEHQTKLQEHFENIQFTQDLLNQELKSLLSRLSANGILDFIKQIYEIKMKLNEIEKTVNTLQQQLPDVINDDKQDFKKRLMTVINRSEGRNLNDYLENYIDRLRQDIEELKLKLEEIQNNSQKRTSQEQLQIQDMRVRSKSLPVKIKPPLMNWISQGKRKILRSVLDASRQRVMPQADDPAVLCHLLLTPVSPSVLDLKENKLVLHEEDNEIDAEDEDETTMVINSNTTPRISQKIRLSNNIVSWIRGPFRVMVDGTMHMVDFCAQATRISDAVVRAAEQGLARQKQTIMEQETTSNSIKPVFTEITSDWTFEGNNTDQGYTSESIWMRNPQGQRILAKTEDHPLCAANERLAYTLGGLLGLPVNEVQISIYQNKLVTLHTDVAQENEKVITFMDLPKQIRKNLLTNPLLESMDLFDRIIHNVDRNPRNILVTISKTDSIDDDNTRLKIHLIDHGSCFGMGKLNVISLVACKFHSNHLSVVTFDPIEKARKFEQYLSRLPVADRTLMRKTLNRLAEISDDQLGNCITEVQDLLSSNQYNRIHSVLYRQRDIARRYVKQWGIGPRLSNLKEHETNEITSETSDRVAYF
ncbi:unnamed protein product [Rotaria sordida]|uniref:Uncharacterized protein n=1 Tax=Rotaria sordida TaxID=392033 RepID=A0A814ZR26_9BILA|nr:unnamed protein product [Rotaria sordida]